MDTCLQLKETETLDKISIIELYYENNRQTVRAFLSTCLSFLSISDSGRLHSGPGIVIAFRRSS